MSTRIKYLYVLIFRLAEIYSNTVQLYPKKEKIPKWYVPYELLGKIKKYRTFNFYSFLLDRLQLAFSYALENILGEI